MEQTVANEDCPDYYQKRQKGVTLNLKRNFAWMLGSKISLIMTTLFTGALINRSLGPFNRGIFAETQTWVMLFIVMFGIGMQSAIYHFANRRRYGYDDKTRFTTVFLLSLTYSIVAALALTLCVRYSCSCDTFGLVLSVRESVQKSSRSNKVFFTAFF